MPRSLEPHLQTEERRVYQLIRTLPVQQLLARQLPMVVLSFIIAEVFYKFRSFTLECAAFLVTWFILDAIAQAVLSAMRGRGAQRTGV
jgi:hypothetical protein